jgi:hypothetical protein
MCNPAVYVVDSDVTAVEGLATRHAAELEQWSNRDELSPTACAVLVFLSMFRGLRGGDDGCGVQLSLATWSHVLGRSRRMVQYAFDELRDRGFILRHRRFVKLDDVWTDDKGRTHTEADVRSVVYLTKLGALRIERRGETRKLKVKAGKGLMRVLTVSGAVGALLETLRPILKSISLRVTDAVSHCTPSVRCRPGSAPSSAEAPIGPKKQKPGGASPSGPRAFKVGTDPFPDFDRSSGSELVENDSSPDERARLIREARAAVREATGSIGGSPRRTFADEVQRCRRDGITTAQLWKPEEWALATPAERAWLLRQFQPIRAAIARDIRVAMLRARFERILYLREAF